MSVQEREYMGQRPDPEIDISQAEGIEAKSQAEAERLLRFACPTRMADGKWYRVTMAMTQVPVTVLYNVLSNMNFIAAHLREATDGSTGELADLIRHRASQIELLHTLLRQEPQDAGPFAHVFSGLNVHKERD